jgi:hypothetical protein
MPTSIEALLIVALVLAPGYVFTQVIRRVLAYIAEPTDARFFLTIITMGIIIHAIMSPWSSRIMDDYLARTLPQNRWEVFAWALTTILFLPLILGEVLGKLIAIRWVDSVVRFAGFGIIDRMPSAWDFIMRQRRPAYVRIHTKDGKVLIAGIYDEKSFVSLATGRTDIYLEQCWQLDEEGNFHQPYADSQGVWVSHDVMGYVEFLNWEEATNGTEGADNSSTAERREVVGARSGQEGDAAGGAREPQAAPADSETIEEGGVTQPPSAP